MTMLEMATIASSVLGGLLLVFGASFLMDGDFETADQVRFFANCMLGGALAMSCALMLHEWRNRT